MMRRAPILFLLLLLPFLGGDLAALPAPVTVTTPLGGGVFTVERFQGREAVSSLYGFTVDVSAARDRDVPFDALLGQDITVTVALPGAPTRYFNGIVSRLSAGDVDTRRHVSIDIAPKAWLLTRTEASRIFQDETVPRIVARILGAVPGLQVEMRLTGSYEPRNDVVQRNESDFDFISRLLEEEGIAYYFRHSDDGHVMVLTDAPDGFGDLPAAHPYRPSGFLAPLPNAVFTWQKTQEIRSGKLTLWDHNFETPGESHEAQAVMQESVLVGSVEHHLGAGGGDALETFDYPGGYAQRFDGVDPGGGEQPAELDKIDAEGRKTAGHRIQHEATHVMQVRGGSIAPDLEAGSAFTLSGLNAEFNGKYLVTGVTHKYAPGRGAGGGYKNEFTGIPAGLPYRPPRATPKPVMHGLETAVVVGPPGEEIFTDKYARVKVKFNWDRTGETRQDGTSSSWIRVASPWAGAGTGAGSGPLILPRVGWEVVVAFEDGDPDRPLIIGSVYNPDHLPPPPPPPER